MRLKRAVVLLSGGLDSTTALAEAIHQGFEPFALTVLYGQTHEREIDAARAVAKAFGIREHHIVTSIDLLKVLGGSALTSDVIDVPKDRHPQDMASGIPVTYVPARNTIFLAMALAWAEVLGSSDLFIGVNAIDYSGYPDCRPEFIAAFENLANLATKAGVEGTVRFRVHAPLLSLSKADIIRRGLELGVDYALTSTCYEPVGAEACGQCDACQLRLKGFEEAGVKDPIPYLRR
jgi:7-cyano-7-deazaguanine synthase